MPTVLGGDFGWLSSVGVLDWPTTSMVGSEAGLQCTARNGLAALDRAVNRQFPDGTSDRGLSLMSDNDFQPASLAVGEACSTLGPQQAFPSYTPQGNADTERVNRSFKGECLRLQEWSGPFQMISTLNNWIEDYSRPSLHSALGYKPPRQCERDHHSRHGPPLAAA
jgi:transposase InsO family protein